MSSHSTGFLADVSRSWNTAKQSQERASRPDADLAGKDGFTFGDIIDAINPLHHIPVVNTLYRSITGDDIDGGARMVGGALYGGIYGLVASTVDWIIEQETGQDTGEHVMTALGFGDDKPTTDQTPMNTASADTAGATTNDRLHATNAALTKESLTNPAPHLAFPEHAEFYDDPVTYIWGPQAGVPPYLPKSEPKGVSHLQAETANRTLPSHPQSVKQHPNPTAQASATTMANRGSLWSQQPHEAHQQSYTHLALLKQTRPRQLVEPTTPLSSVNTARLTTVRAYQAAIARVQTPLAMPK